VTPPPLVIMQLWFGTANHNCMITAGVWGAG